MSWYDLPLELRAQLSMINSPVFVYRCPGRLLFFDGWAARIEAVVRPFEDDYQAALTAQRSQYASSRIRR